ncbi:hypothetical protein ABIC45_000190 [Mucilaginibacter rubeus]
MVSLRKTRGGNKTDELSDAGNGLRDSPLERGGGVCYSVGDLSLIQHTPPKALSFAPSQEGSKKLKTDIL